MAPFVPDDILLQILLRLPPRPSCFRRASLVCKRWRALVTDPAFLRQLRRAPAVLGVFINNLPLRVSFVPSGDPPDRVPDSRFRRPELPWLVRDSRRGLVLLGDGPRRCFQVWDPVTDATRFVPTPPVAHIYYCHHRHGFGAVLLPDDDDNVTGRGGFRVALAFVVGGYVNGVVYCSDSGTWTHHATAQIAPISAFIQWTKTPGVVVGDSVYWLIDNGRVLSLKLPAGGQPLVLGAFKPRNASIVHDYNVKLMRTPDGKLGLAAVTGYALRLWVLEADDGGGTVAWTLCRKILLEALFPGPRRWRHPDDRFGEIRSLALAVVLLDEDRGHLHDDPTPCARIVGVDEDGAMVFLHRSRMDEDELFMLELLPAPRIKKIRDSYFMAHKEYDTVYAFASSFFAVGNI